MKQYRSETSGFSRVGQIVARGFLVAFTMPAVSGIVSARTKQDKKDDFTIDLLTTPTTPTTITPPVGNKLFLAGHGIGSQGYVCLPFGTGFSWTVNNPRPEATLFASVFGEPVEIITHFLSHNDNPAPERYSPLRQCDLWQSSFDSSKVWAAASLQTTINAGTDPSCLNTGSIGCLLLQTVGKQDGPTGGKILSKTTFIQRLNTKGGSAPSNPATGCLVPGDVGHQVLVPYSADYFFYHADD